MDSPYKNRIKKIPVGFEDFGDIIKQNFYYVDKTLFIKELIDNYSLVNLFTRPRRFGKTLNISMFQYYFDVLYANESHVFEGLAISEEEDYYKSYQNQFPVIKMTLKGAVGETFDSALKKIKTIVSDEFKRHDYLLHCTTIKAIEKDLYHAIMNKTADIEDYENSLKLLSSLLHRHYNKKTIILIDEYDVPLEKAYTRSYYAKMVSFIREFFSDALKTNSSLFFSVITGCLRVSKESIFTGLNNLDIISITSNEYSEHFGFTEPEVEDLLAYYKLEHKLEEMRNWYNGYLFGDSVVYNPWSAIEYLKDARSGQLFPRSHWANTSSNEVVRNLIDISDTKTKEEIEHLIAGGSLIKPIKEDVVYADVYHSMDNLWNYMFFTGYLKKVSERMDGVAISYELKIPNKEVQYIFERHIAEWFNEKVKVSQLQNLYQSIIDGDDQTFTDEISSYLMEVISYMDNAENFYHGFLSGLLRSMDGHRIKSNRETSDGRSDIIILPNLARQQAFIIEIKIAKKVTDLERKCDEALAQIEEKRYMDELALDGYTNVVKYGMAFFKKTCMVKMK